MLVVRCKETMTWVGCLVYSGDVVHGWFGCGWLTFVSFTAFCFLGDIQEMRKQVNRVRNFLKPLA